MMLYLVTVSGFALNMHYCFNRLRSVKVDEPAKACTKVLESNKMKCCKDQKINIKVKDAHQSTSPLYWSKFFPIALLAPVFPGLPFSIHSIAIVSVVDRGPPLSPGTPIFLKNCIFRI